MHIVERILIAAALGVLLFLFLQQRTQMDSSKQEEAARMLNFEDQIAELTHRLDCSDEKEQDTAAKAEPDSPSAPETANPQTAADAVPDPFDPMGFAPVTAT